MEFFQLYHLFIIYMIFVRMTHKRIVSYKETKKYFKQSKTSQTKHTFQKNCIIFFWWVYKNHHYGRETFVFNNKKIYILE